MVTFHWSDYFIFAILLLFYALFGIIIKFKYDNRGKRKIVEYALANRTMTLIPVTVSILVTYFSAISIIGVVAEVYISGIEFLIIGFSYFIAIPLAAFVYLPTFYKLNIVSVHEYLELRFSKLIRLIISIVYVFQTIFHISVVLYAPSLAFSQVSGLSLWVSILSTGVVCTVYTALGGMRAVIWTDLIQFFIMVAGILTIVILGSNKIGGISVVWDIAKKTDHIKLFNFDTNPFIRQSFWSLLFGATGLYLSLYGTNQAQVQRYLSCRNEKTAVRTLLLNAPLTYGFLMLLIITGLVTYSSFIFCDPLSRGVISKKDQILPYFVIDLLQNYSPLSGLFMSSIFAAALSTMSSGINSLSAVIMEDLMNACSRVIHRSGSPKSSMGCHLILIAFGLGVITILLALLFPYVSPTVLQVSISLSGMAGGPILSVFTMGLIIPCVNEKGALVGLIGSLFSTLWLGIGAIVRAPVKSGNASTNISDCYNFTLNLNQTVTTPNKMEFSLYNLSYLYYPLVAIIICTFLSISVSAVTGFNSKRKIKKKLFFVIIPKLSKYWPASFQSQIEDENENFEKEEFPALNNNGEMRMK